MLNYSHKGDMIMKIFDYIFDKRPKNKKQTALRNELYHPVYVPSTNNNQYAWLKEAIKNSGYFTDETRMYE